MVGGRIRVDWLEKMGDCMGQLPDFQPSVPACLNFRPNANFETGRRAKIYP